MATITHELSTPARSRRRWRVFFTYILPPAVVILVVLLPAISTISVLPRLGASPGFILTDQHGAQVSSESLRGDIIVFGIAALDCRDACAATLDAMRQVRAEYAGPEDADGLELRLVTIIVDAVDDPAQLGQFAAEQGITGADWSVLSGSPAAVRALVASGFEVRLGETSGGAVDYEPAIFLSDQAGFMRGEYRSERPRASVISGDVERVLDEATAGGVGGLFYNAAHSLSLSCGG